ncbi:hypothetical protein IB260_00550 [Pseudomonas sp. PDM23]|uniref:hypothetical protein n=1 Tax=unclassified Pseudomonas TaxID=196821 RepID=UPI001786FD9F|nr:MULTISPECIES: hypothetical protein [unclassified Pseudomonas]MBD9573783.1 hypothetical protein [Pseudomonas sp. PDM23]MBD9671621.1 hypothetical protein [Pseudomonas sp. PDM21]
MTIKHELPADLDNYIAGLRIENINLKLAAKQAEALLREMRTIFSIPPYWHERIDAFLASQQGEQTVEERNEEILRKFSAWVNDEHPEQAEGAQGEREVTPNQSCSMCRGSGYFFEFSTVETCWCCLPKSEPEETVEALKARIESLKACITHMKQQRDAAIARAALAQPSPAPELERPRLKVWSAAMPESNGKSNFTAILMREGGDICDGFTIARSEYPDRVRYEADCVRWLIGELPEKPFILDYDANKHSGYKAPVAQAGQVPEEWRDMLANLQWHYRDHDDYWHRPQGYYCPQCGGEKDKGHEQHCELAALLAAAPAQGGSTDE